MVNTSVSDQKQSLNWVYEQPRLRNNVRGQPVPGDTTLNSQPIYSTEAPNCTTRYCHLSHNCVKAYFCFYNLKEWHLKITELDAFVTLVYHRTVHPPSLMGHIQEWPGLTEAGTTLIAGPATESMEKDAESWNQRHNPNSRVTSDKSQIILSASSFVKIDDLATVFSTISLFS